MDFTITRTEDEIQFRVTGKGFLHNMVRILVGTLLEVGAGERTADRVSELFGKERALAGADGNSIWRYANQHLQSNI